MKSIYTKVVNPNNGLPPYKIEYLTDGFSFYQRHIWLIDKKEEFDSLGIIQISAAIFNRSAENIRSSK